MVIRKALLAVVGAVALAGAGYAASNWHHALSLVGEVKYGPDFEHFKWVRPDAPKGGVARLQTIGTFDSLNPYSTRGNPAAALVLIYDDLMTSSPDEPSAQYGLIAESVSYPDDYSSVTFRLRPEARFHDGEPVKPEDVIFSFEALQKEGMQPFYAYYYKNVVAAEKTGEREVTFRFDVTGNRELPQIMGQLPVLPKHYWTAEGRSLTASTLTPPLGGGPYRISHVDAGRTIAYERVPDYWAKDLPVYKGQWNFDEVRFEYFRDDTVAFEAFKAGKIDFHQESSAKNWATGYDFPAARSGQVKKEEIELNRPAPMQSFAFNTRRSKFADPRVRRAFNLAYEFEWANKNLFYDQYRRVESYFQNQELQSEGAPTGRELEILRAVKAEFPEHVPDEALARAFENPVNADQRDLRRNLGEATKLLNEAGWQVRNNVLTNTATGEAMTVEFLLVSPAFERVVLPYAQNLQRLGIRASVRVVDTSQYRLRLDNFDFDVVVASFSQSESPGNEQRDFWGSDAADRTGSRNLIGIKNPAVDKLIDLIIFAPNREELVAATRALDRVLLWHHYVVPQWYSPTARIAYWDKFDRPETLPSQAVSFLQVWWWDAEAARKLAAVAR